AIEVEQRDAIHGSSGQRVTIPSGKIADLVVAEPIAFEILLHCVLRDHQFTERAVRIIPVRGILPRVRMWMALKGICQPDLAAGVAQRAKRGAHHNAYSASPYADLCQVPGDFL